ncbi:hypothetical protein L210DRAFT_3647076 [Boletus edulis BED1]|uniref:Uncharacterized protein n=1 Tax=Boletus edulis BED1 TaxID=1328754 RepID=A0AAD4BRH5_BOLED|nr:hypothetical protein L210DRAFT_3647076 [Boletus edulis BED1]
MFDQISHLFSKDDGLVPRGQQGKHAESSQPRTRQEQSQSNKNNSSSTNSAQSSQSSNQTTGPASASRNAHPQGKLKRAY